jgi:hypothetical protein
VQYLLAANNFFNPESPIVREIVVEKARVTMQEINIEK